MHQLEKDFLLYGEFDVNSTVSIIKLLDSLDNRTSYLERIVEMEVKAWTDRFLTTAHCPAYVQSYDAPVHQQFEGKIYQTL